MLSYILDILQAFHGICLMFPRAYFGALKETVPSRTHYTASTLLGPHQLTSVSWKIDL